MTESDRRIVMYETPLMALDHLPLPAVVVDAACRRIVLGNRYASERFGYTPEELRGVPVSILFPAVDGRDGDLCALCSTSRDDLSGPCEVVVLCRLKNGDQARLPAATQELGDGVSLVVFPEERATLPARIGTLDRRVQALLAFAYDAYSDYDIITGYIDFSEQMDRILGYPTGGAPRTFWEWAHLLHPDDRHRVFAELREALRGGSAQWCSEYRLRRRDGTYVLVLDQCVILEDEHGRASHMVGAVRDITSERQAVRSLRESAELYRTLFLNAVNPAFRVSEEGSYVDVNDPGLRFFECTRAEFLSRSAYADLPHDLLSTARQGGVSTEIDVEREISVVINDVTKHLHITMMPAQVASQTTFFFFGTDITALKVLQSELQDRNAAMRALVDQMHSDRQDMETRAQRNLDESVTPILDRLRRVLGSRPEAAYVDAIEDALRDAFRPLSLRTPADDGTPTLTRREAEVANLIRLGKTTEEIAEVLSLTPSAVQFHRSNLRRKLGLGRGGPRLATYLASLGGQNAPRDRERGAQKR